ncbi:MAG: glutamine--tRNA ligase/YqeY domain fusion protein [Bacteroidia bacterium]
MSSAEKTESLNFIEHIIEDDLKSGHTKAVYTRFPPEPNGYLHLGHAKSICLNFGLGQQYGGKTNLRFDDTNPEAEDIEYVDSIMEDVRWLGFEWEGEARYASDYFDQLYDWAVEFIKAGKAYVDFSSAEEMSRMRGVPTRPGEESPYRNRPVEDSLEDFEKMKNGEFAEGECVLRAKIDMTSPNMHMRDPVMYRIKHAHHHRTGDKWHIYPSYDWAHGQSDAIEGITHSICTLEFEVHRPLYEWFLDQLPPFDPRPKQREFARLNLSYTIMSKRKLKQLVEEGYVSGWDDPRMPTISGIRRRGYTPEAIREFAERIGVARRENVIELSQLEFSVRNHLNKITDRVMAVLDPLKVVITNYPEGEEEWLEVENNPEDENSGSRTIPFSREIYIEREDFMEEPPKKFFRLGPGASVRLKGAYIITCDDYIKDAEGNVTELHCRYYPDSKSGSDTSGIKAKGVLHFVSAAHAVPAEVRLYDRLFSDPEPEGHEGKTYIDFLNPESLVTIEALVEPSLKDVEPGTRLQFMRKGYFCVDPDSKPGALVFNRTVTLKDAWAKAQN